jgi:TP901 family phage tail tape measure protein
LNPAAVLSILVKAQGVSAATGELARLEGAAKAASASTDTMAKKTKGSFTEVNKQSKYAALGVLGVAGAAVKMAADFQSSMNQLQAVSGVSTRELGKLRKEAIKLGADTKLPATSAKDAAEAMKEMVKAGVSVKDTMGGVRDVLVLSAAAGVSNAKAAEIASNAMNAFKLQGKDVKKITDELANTANASSVEITDVADSFQMAAAVFSGFQSPAIGAKKAMTELNVAIGLLGNAGIKGSDAGTSLKQALLQLTGPSNKSKDAMKALYIAAKDAGASQKLLAGISRDGATERGKELDQLIKHNKALGGSADIAYDATGKMRGLKDIIALVTKGTSKMTQEERNSYLTQIFGADATRSVIALMQAGPQAFDKMTASVTKQGAAQDLANSKMKGLKGSFEALKSSLETLAISVGTVLLPPLEKIVRAITALIPLVEKNKDVFAALGATLLVTAAGARALSVTMPLVTAGMAASTAAGGGLTGVLIGLKAAFLAIPVFAVIAGIAALVAALVIAYRQSDAFRNIVNALGAAVVSAFQTVVAAVTSATNTVVNEVGQWDSLWSAIMRGFSIVKAAAQLFFDALRAIFSVGMLLLGPIVVAALTTIKDVFSGAWTAIKGIVKGGFDVLRGIVKVIGGLFKGDFRQVWDGIKTIFTGGITALKGILKGAWAILKAPVDALATGMHDAFAHSWDRIKDLFRTSINTVIDFLNLLIKGINAIPGVPDIHAIGHIGGGGSGGNKGPSAGDLHAAGFARGGAFGRTGGMVGKSMVFMGEDAPQHPEYVIPTNPAYRKRARGLLSQAAGAIGFAQGGVYSKNDLAALWSRVNPGLGNANLMAAIALAESGGKSGAHNASGASGLWQILGVPFPGNPFDAATNARMAGAKLRSQGLGAWEAYTNGSYKQFLGGGAGGGLSGLAGSVVHFLGSAVHSVGDIIGKLPHPKGLGMMQGLGEYVLGKVTGYVKDKAASLFTGGGGGGVSGTVQDAIRIAMTMGFAHPSTGQLTGGKHVAGSYHYQGRAADFGSAGHSVGEMTGLFNALRQRFGSHIKELFYDPIGYYIKNGARVPGAIGGHSDHVHIALARGGVWGGYGKGTGGAAPGMAWVGERGPELVRFKGGEQVFSHRDSLRMLGDGVGGYASGTAHSRAVAAAKAAASKKSARQAAAIAGKQAAADHATAVRIAKQRSKHVLNPQNPADVFYARMHGIRIAPTKGLSPAQVSASGSSIGGDTGGGDTGGDDPNQPLIDAINAAAEIQTRLDDDVKAMKASIDAQTAFATSVANTSNFQLTKSLADLVSGRIVGYGVAGRAFTPGTGTDYAY